MRLMVRRRWIVLAVLAAISGVAGWLCAGLGFDSSIEIWFLDDDPDLLTYNEFLERFEADEVLVVGVFADDVFAPEVLGSIARISKAARDAPYVHRVRSLTTVKIFESKEDWVELGKLVRKLPGTAEEAAAVREKALGHPLLEGLVVSKDGKATAVLVEMEPEGNTSEGKTELVNAVQAIVDREKVAGMEVRLSGTPVFDAAFFEYTERDFGLLFPVTSVLILVAMFLVFRRVSSALVPLSVVLVTNLWTFAIMAAVGLEMNVVSSSMAVVILAVGVADAVHVLSEYYRHLLAGEEPADAVPRALDHVFVPCLFTSATTMAGFASLCVSDLSPVRELGALAAAGVGIAFLLSFTMVPALLGAVRPPDPGFLERQRRGPASRLLGWLGRPNRRRNVIVAVCAVIVTGAAIYSVSRIRMGANPIQYFKESDPVRLDVEAIDAALGGTTTIEALVSAPGGGLKEPEILRRIDGLQEELEALPGVSKTFSIIDAYKDLRRVLEGGAPEAAKLPDTRPMAAQLYLVLEGDDDLDTIVQDDGSVGRITASVSLSDSKELIDRMPELDARVARDFSGEELNVVTTGYIKLMVNMESYMVSSLAKSLSLAFCVVAALLFLMLRSLRLGVLALIPNMWPILVGLGIMAPLGIELDPGTLMIGSIALGIVVDDTVHFLFRLRWHLDRGRSTEEAIIETMSDAGRPILVTSVVLAAGFLVMLIGTFAPNVHFGFVSAAVILLALVADLLVLPAVLLLWRPGAGAASS